MQHYFGHALFIDTQFVHVCAKIDVMCEGLYILQNIHVHVNENEQNTSLHRLIHEYTLKNFL